MRELKEDEEMLVGLKTRVREREREKEGGGRGMVGRDVRRLKGTGKIL